LLSDALEVAAAARADERAVYWGGTRTGAADAIPRGFRAAEQIGGDLGARLEGAFDDLLRAPGDRVVIVGADCPEMTARTVDAAFDSLSATDLVLGPTRDGGYYLVGLSRRAPELFRDMPWSTASVLQRTLDRARAARLSWSQLDTLEDLDTPADLVGLVARGLLDRRRLPRHTAAALEAIGLLPPVR
jgi:rSAM/selenodomain-associated transferase 1